MKYTITPVKEKPISKREKSPYLEYYYCTACGWIPKESANEHLHCPHCGLRVRTKPIPQKKRVRGVKRSERRET